MPRPVGMPWRFQPSPDSPSTTTDMTCAKQAVGGIRAYGRQIARYPRAFAKSLAVVDLLAEGPVELALVGAPHDPGLEALHLRRARGIFTAIACRHQRWNGQVRPAIPYLRQRVGRGEGGTLHLSELFLPASPHRSAGGHRALLADVETI